MDRGELRATAAVKALIGELGGAVLEQVLAALEEEIAHPSPHTLRLGQLKRQKHLLDRVAAEVIEGDEDEERAHILECQTKLRAFALVAGLNARGTPKQEAKSARAKLKRQDVAESAKEKPFNLVKLNVMWWRQKKRRMKMKKMRRVSVQNVVARKPERT